MPRFQHDPQARALGEALATLRRERDLSQAEAGARAGMTSQGWGLYESGKRQGIFRPDVQRRLTAALEATPEALALALKAQSEPDQSEAIDGLSDDRSRHFIDDSRRYVVRDNALSPWATQGVVLTLDPHRAPTAGQGVVVALQNGRREVRLFEGETGGGLLLRRSFGVDGVERVARRDVVSLAVVTARGEPET